MLKKLLFWSIFVTIFLFIPTKTLAQSNTFECRWDSPRIKCIISDPVFGSSVDCKEGYVPDVTYCDKFKTGLACDGASPGNCVGQFEPGSGITPEQNPTCNIGGQTGIDTAIGCIPINDPEAFVGFFIKWGIGIGGGIAFLLIIYAGFQIMTASGNPDALKSGQELMTSAIAGLILIILSVFILQVIGVGILDIPGFAN